ncbi:MAG TPA: DegV family protein [Aggregatilinea sp.]|uniref:DegV family protein n=1 Tax=Aggregatilinea sp. TaxID=2806333 RepID=UPI002C055456|nr:DegV family protein [Aggregatilinea sp.]HML22195.1 DegV family protein [Aggregatilinea sp.]
MARILVVTDSTCDLPAEWIRQYDIRIVPTYVQFGQESFADDGVQITRTEFYHRMVSSPFHPTTAAGSVGETSEAMARALNDADHVIGITAAAQLSGLFNTFRLAAEDTDPARVTLIDSRQTSMGLGWQVYVAASMAQAGASVETITLRIQRMQPFIEVYAALDTMEHLRRSGRVGWATAVMGNLFQIKPIVSLHEGVVSSVARVRTSHRLFEALVELAHHLAPFDYLAIMHTVNPNGAQRLRDALADIRPETPVPIVDATPVLGVHVGPNGIGLGIVRKIT